MSTKYQGPKPSRRVMTRTVNRLRQEHLNRKIDVRDDNGRWESFADADFRLRWENAHNARRGTV